MSPLLAFYRRQAPDNLGRTLGDILGWDDGRLEHVHDFIQWLFPLPEASAFNADAPLLARTDIEAFHADPSLRRALCEATERMLRFYGFILADDPASLLRGSPKIVPDPDAAVAGRQWLTPGNHNFLRISRMLRSLRLLGLADVARAFLDALLAVAVTPEGSAITPRTLDFWRGALR